MATVTRALPVPTDAVWQVLADGWTYATWVVGASRIRDVDADFPAPGTSIHHSVGVWPLLLSDRTDVVESDPGRRLVLRARGWPVGEARIDVRLSAEGEGCRVEIDEFPTAGPGRVLHTPVHDAVLAYRLREMLDRLAALASGRARDRSG